MKIMKSVAFFLALVAVSSCSYTPFTQELYKENGWSERDLKSIQFYVSETLVLERLFQEGDTRIEGGKIQVKDGRKVERIVIAKRTPGVLIEIPQEDRFVISFDATNDQAALRFGPNPKTNNQYILMARDWNRGRGKVLYDGREYVITTDGAMARLLVDLRKHRDEKVKTKRATGRRI